ncbi:MAG: 1-deoxy-D-xylulose-5-phosphate reductoisomerase [Actinobacteria bacterium]|nr:MAG: 1-deoxy-D-xylulose-5-phosphate reductoisomerase [Actinomycetota bacterium]
MTTTLAVLGSTGSIGTQTLDIVRTAPERFEVVALGAATSVAELAAQVHEFRPRIVALADSGRAAELKELVPSGVEVLAGPDAMADAAREAQTVINGVVGFAGLPVTLAALAAGRRLGLANKESLIAAGPVVARVRSTPGAELLPVDSEHCALHQCLRANDNPARVAKLVLTASGGPFRGKTRGELAEVTIDDALAHPTWRMGPKITVDSSTLMNKGLEVIEARELFGATHGIDFDDIDVVVHPQSIVHSMVTFTDGATLAQMSMPDMRLCMAYALEYPDRSTLSFGAIDWTTLSRLDFELPDHHAFPCLNLAYHAGRSGETAPAWLSAANEVAVDAFLNGLMRWTSIADVLSAALDRWPGSVADSVEAVLAADAAARDCARAIIERRAA